jgi:hypothetical protein
MPLLDLLLIMIFSLYLEVRERSERREEQADRRVAAAEAEVEKERRTLGTERARLAEREGALEAENEDLRGRVEDVVEQQRRAADLIAELFDVPADLVDEALRPRPGEAARSAEETERLRQKFRDLAAARGPAVIEHLLTHEELRKRADVWTLRIRANGEIVFSSGDRTQSFRAATAEEFATRLYERYKTLPQPKGIVVLLVSYGDARADVRQAVLAGLPEAVRRLREDSLGRTQFEYAVLGFIPEEDGRED